MDSAIQSAIDSLIKAHLPHWVALRRDLHANPELRYEEFRTAEVAATELASLGYDVKRGLGGTGVVATLPGASGAGAILLRADMDALPIHEACQHEHASRFAGKMHACGHDGHTVMLLGAARVLKELPPLPGTVHFVFQPAEEGGLGAKRMLDDGLLELYPTDAVFGMHNWPSLPAGHFGLRTGPIMAASTRFRIEVKGKGAHAAQPEKGIDPIPIACAVVQQCQTLCARHKSPVDPAVVSICTMLAGETDNVLPESVEMRGTIRALSTRLLEQLQTDILRLCKGVAQSYGAQIDVDYAEFCPATVNSPVETAFCETVLRSTFGDTCVHASVPPNMTAEDFGFMLQARPGTYVLAGGGQDKGLHHPEYDFNDALIPTGVLYWVALASEYFSPHRARETSRINHEEVSQ
ncbi:M20 aminoacylase family protein [Trinickia dinghuensis]|uniref:Amidohydrolase n=1 Tax=Trinickia dinghuensis TaxID=2291023 RepID=A0A3D8K4U9_9BURK|nr:M20 aminoacylase family protein [Trinickia dinghuensis]RDV00478.1 amidohydrolase [Trinickia dinghuensis]